VGIDPVTCSIDVFGVATLTVLNFALFVPVSLWLGAHGRCRSRACRHGSRVCNATSGDTP
jgi:hypothetical protein